MLECNLNPPFCFAKSAPLRNNFLGDFGRYFDQSDRI